MDVAPGTYALLDAGGGRRLERFGDVVLDRPAPGAGGPRGDPAAWELARARFERRGGSADGRWEPPGVVPDRWEVLVDGLRLELRPTPAGQVGLFPEHLEVARWVAGMVPAMTAELGRQPVVLNLFAYTGLATLALARAGAAVAHVDASRPAVAWARRNATLAGVEDRPVRWLVEDASRFVAREVRRGRRYDGVVLDPPTYGHGPDGSPWHIEDGLPRLLAAMRPLLDARRSFVACTAHAAGLWPATLEGLVLDGLQLGRRPVELRELTLDAASGARLAGGWAVLGAPGGAGEER